MEPITYNCEDIISDLNFTTVRDWKAQHPDAKAIAYFPVYAPVEIIHACGMLPVGLSGAGDQLDIQYADARFGSFICSIVKTTLEIGFIRRFTFLFDLRFGTQSLLRLQA